MLLRFSLLAAVLAFSSSAVAQDKISIVNEGGIGSRWMLAPGASLVSPAYPEIYKSSGAEVCVAIGYLLNADGTTSDFTLLKSWSSAEPTQARDGYWNLFASDASSALARWKFAPRPEVVEAKPVYTVATFLFGAVDVAELRRKCAIPDLMQHIYELRNDSRTRRKMSSISVFDRLDIDPSMVNRTDQQHRSQSRGESELSRDQRNSGRRP